ncbi:unnamed protein product [Zymoseptoria tritici ST99CH_3D7]|uniref:Beta-glucuronidase C-terminal domain-containing protein n=1 Tax=Zymoseptoria tritici (strain ST99CH_3D7) TaxID=1276538 RepID=A0A1X7RHC8_ZYMT9|nr:unnamed protein product [Zymoseptoria tritici ST99CH_3D7]
MSKSRNFAILLYFTTVVAALTYNVSSSSPATASGPLSVAPVGISFEFFTFPEYFTSVNATDQCLQNLKDVGGGASTRIRIGGTTQDRATYDHALSADVKYAVASPKDAPASLTYGPSFFARAGTYGGRVTVGLNRELNKLNNTIAAARVAQEKMSNLEAIELGNEPEYYSSTSPIAEGQAWTAQRDYASQISWQMSLGQNLSTPNIIQAGVYLEAREFNNKDLASNETTAALEYVKTFDSHHYPQSGPSSNLTSLMNHAEIVSRAAAFKGEVAAAKSKGKIHVFGETNSATQGGGGISPTFGAGLWIVDYVMQAMILGSESLFFHQGTIGNCQYCWWGRFSMGAPYYGAYFATQALANVAYIAQLDEGSSQYAAYALYDSNKALTKVLLYNSDYYTSGTRSAQNFTLTGLTGSSTTAVRLTASFATSRQDQGQIPTVGGQSFEDGTCVIQGTPVKEKTVVADVSLYSQLFVQKIVWMNQKDSDRTCQRADNSAE